MNLGRCERPKDVVTLSDEVALHASGLLAALGRKRQADLLSCRLASTTSGDSSWQARVTK